MEKVPDDVTGGGALKSGAALLFVAVVLGGIIPKSCGLDVQGRAFEFHDEGTRYRGGRAAQVRRLNGESSGDEGAVEFLGVGRMFDGGLAVDKAGAE